MQFLDLTLPTLAANLALDEALLSEVEAGNLSSLLRIWEFPRYAVVLGASGKIQDDVDQDRCREDSVVLGRRSSGGGTVVLGPGALNFTVILAADEADGLLAVDLAQTFVLSRAATALDGLAPGIEVRGSGDLTRGGRKFAGSAQRRLKRHFLVHTSLLYDFDLARISKYTRVPERQPAYREGRPHDEFVTNLDASRASIVDALREVWGAWEVSSSPSEALQARVRDLARDKFGQESWVYRLMPDRAILGANRSESP